MQLAVFKMIARQCSTSVPQIIAIHAMNRVMFRTYAFNDCSCNLHTHIHAAHCISQGRAMRPSDSVGVIPIWSGRVMPDQAMRELPQVRAWW